MNSQLECPLVRAVKPESRRRLGFLGRWRAQAPVRAPGTELHLMTLSAQGRRLRKLGPGDEGLECSPEDYVFCVFTQALPFELGFSAVLADAQGASSQESHAPTDHFASGRGSA